MEIIHKNYQKKIKLNFPQIIKISKMILRHEGVRQAALSICFVSHQKIKALNYKFLNRNHATDVLAFDNKDNTFNKKNVHRKSKDISGDIIISTDAALKNAKAYNVPLNKELSLYIIHGILHLLGYDDHKSSDINRMRKKEKELLSFLGTRTKSIVK